MHKETPMSETLSDSCNLIKKETMAELFSCDFCEIFKDTFFYRTTSFAASVKIYQLKILQNEVCVYIPTYMFHVLPSMHLSNM